MSPIPWTSKINFASALLLHSCITVILKEAINIIVISKRCLLRSWESRVPRTSNDRLKDQIITSIVLDAYTLVLSRDLDGELSELYFTNTGVILLAATLASSVVMNLMAPSGFLIAFVASTFGVTFLASLAVGEKDATLPIIALRRGREVHLVRYAVRELFLAEYTSRRSCRGINLEAPRLHYIAVYCSAGVGLHESQAGSLKT